MIVNDIDLGPSNPWPAWQQGQVMGSALIEGTRTIIWPRGATLIKQDVVTWITAWQAIGGQSAMTLGAARYLVRQLEELAANPDLQPVYIQWTASAASGAFNRADEHDGWYVIENVAPNYRKYIVGGIVECRMTVAQVAAAAPASLAAWYSGAALASTFTQAATPLVAYPIGSFGQAYAAGYDRTGAEGAYRFSVAPLTGSENPLTFVRPGTVAGHFTGQVRVFDTINTGTNPVPTSGGTFTNANWVEVKGTQHDFVGDCVVTNGLLLLLYQVSQTNTPSVYFWNTQGTPNWQLAGSMLYRDNSPANGTLREVNLDRVGLEEARVRTRYSSGQWAELRHKLQRGMRHYTMEFQPLTQSNTNFFALSFQLSGGNAKIGFNDSNISDVAVSPNALAATTLAGFGAAFGQTANGPILGWLYQNPPSAGQYDPNNATEMPFGDSNGPAQGTFRLYGFFVTPWVSAPNLQAEGESGTLGTGWSSVADGAASGGNTAKAASGTASGNADLFGVSYVPTAGQYDIWFRVKVTSAAGSAAEMTLGWWDATSSAFVTNGSTTFRANQASTSYGWLKANTALMTPTAAHNTQFRAVTAAALGTDWFIDEAVLVPRQSSTLGAADFPGDIYSQFAFDRTVRWARG